MAPSDRSDWLSGMETRRWELNLPARGRTAEGDRRLRYNSLNDMMKVFDLFSKRQKRRRGETPDVYTYDQLPQEFRVQVVHILRDTLGLPQRNQFGEAANREVWKTYFDIVQALAREYGMIRLCGSPTDDETGHHKQLFDFFFAEQDVERALDVIELSFSCADNNTRRYDYMEERDHNRRVDASISELNARFREHGIGYQFEDGEIVRVDSDLLHSETVKPALTLLNTRRFSGPREEFLRAHEHYRHGRDEEALTEALKAFESTMKAICKSKGWSHDPNATARPLVNTCFTNGLIDQFWQAHISGLRSTLENSINTARNKLGGHGQGATNRVVPREIVTYVLHMTASTIVFLIQSAES